MSLGRALALLIVTSIAVFAIGAMDSDGDRLIHVTPDRLEAEASPFEHRRVIRFRRTESELWGSS